VEDKEITEFLNNLTEQELSDYNILQDNILHNAVYMQKIYRDNKLVAIGGIANKWHMFPYSFHMVKTDYQSQGIGRDIGKNTVDYARDHKLPFVMTTVKMSNIRSFKIIQRLGCIHLYNDKNIYYSLILLDKRWIWFVRLLKIILPIYNSPIGRLVKVFNGRG
jgi:RimJ/RimL family protein N-acetyltransferase